MVKTSTDILIIGAGLTGLTLAYLLNKKGLDFHIIEARDRIGGRIFTVGEQEECPLEMGATWIGQDHGYTLSLLKELGIDVFEQVIGQQAIYEQSSMSPAQLVTLPSNPAPSYRIDGGTSSLINSLIKIIPIQAIDLNQAVVQMALGHTEVEIKSAQQLISAKQVITTLPPHLLQTIVLDPPLPSHVQDILQNCHTWMGESIKVGFRFKKPFWREQGTSGTIFSNVGPITEFYDHSSADDSLYGLKGFLNGAYYNITREERKEIALNQLRKYYGDEIDSYTSYEEAVWRKEAFTFNAYKNHLLPHQNNGHEVFQQGYYDNKLFIAGAETSSRNPGYMEGAIRSAFNVFKELTAATS